MHIYILQIQHEVLHYDGWKKAFENDPVDRKKAGVRRYKIFRQTDNPNYVVVHLEFDDVNDAEKTLASLRLLWPRVEGKIMIGPEARILHLEESKDI
jgi:hypothetical protein